MAVGHVWQGGMRDKRGGGACMAATAADGTHPTGMHSCFKCPVHPKK